MCQVLYVIIYNTIYDAKIKVHPKIYYLYGLNP